MRAVKAVALLSILFLVVHAASAQNVGIGTASPSARFHVQGDGTNAPFRVDDQAADATPFLIDASGNVGVGVTAPLARFQVVASTYNTGLRITTSGNAGAGVYFDADNRDWVLLGTNAGAGAGDQAFGLFDETGGLYRWVTDRNGNFGVGTVSPARRLDVAGTGRFTGALTVGSYTLPTADGTSGQVLATDGAGNISWQSASGLPSSAIVGSQTQNNPTLTSAGFTFFGRMANLETAYDSSGWQVVAASPSGSRGSHTAVWTGTKMIVWGGTNGTTAVNTGGSYDPATDTWSSVSTTGAPGARSYHSAVWTGSKMIVWGGTLASGTTTNTGGIYDPATDTWTSLSTTGAPTGRYYHRAVWTGSKMIVWGGFVNGTTLDSTGALYDPATDTWTPVGSAGAPSPRATHAAVWTGSKMLVWGGLNGSSLNTGGAYDPATDSWTTLSTASAPAARLLHAAVWTGSKMIVWGGQNTVTGILAAGSSYDPVTDSWTAISSTGEPAARAYHEAVWTGTQMFVWGGVDGGGTLVNTGGFYNPSTDAWTTASQLGSVPQARYLHTIVWTGGAPIVWGGANLSGTYLDSGGLYQASGLTLYNSPGYLYLFRKN